MKTATFARKHVRRIILAAAFIAVPLLVAARVEMPTIVVPINDTVRGATEDIQFSGQVSITPKLVDDAGAIGGTTLQLMMDFSQVKGRGLTTGKRYLTSAQAEVQRRIMTSAPVQCRFPYYPASNPMASRTVIAAFSVRYSPPAGLEIGSRLISPSA